ncbi:MAG TPA: energy transducer TonB [Chitinophagaceae bacterium]|nr:energy transducer TonB [Chitinophagaceae bacterium]
MIKRSTGKVLLTAVVGMAALLMISSCGNDTNSSTAEHPTTLPDTGSTTATTAAGTDTTTTRAATANLPKKKKGMASVSLSADNTAGTTAIVKGKDGVYSRADKMPEYPGGEAALSKFIEDNVSYPQDAMDENTEGTVHVAFVVDEKGRVVNPVATGKMAGHGLDNEAVKVIKQMPAWKPGMVKGKPVKTRLLLPVTFKLSDV